MNNIAELRTSLNTLFDEIKNGSIDVKVAAEMNNTAGKIIQSLKVQLDYSELRKEPPSIPYMGS